MSTPPGPDYPLDGEEAVVVTNSERVERIDGEPSHRRDGEADEVVERPEREHDLSSEEDRG
jgi:hypothetical protein